MKTKIITFILLCIAINAAAQNSNTTDEKSIYSHVVTKWGDQGNGTYINPILNADYSDPDAIRVGDKYYMVASDFHFMGMQMLESDDLVNWTIISKVYDRIDFPEYDNMERYGRGSWAPALRYHDGKFWVYFCTPDEGLFMSQATDPRGPWSPLHNIKHIAGWEDPCPFWDEDGKAYLGRSILGAGPIIIHKMSEDGRTLLDDGYTVYTGPVAEGTKIHKKDGYYYLSIPEGGVWGGWQTVLRSKNIYGPYEKKVVMEKGISDINGPHQGSIVDTPDGQWWFLHFQQFNSVGRIVHLQPMHWNEGWPVIGIDRDFNGIGEPVTAWIKPSWESGMSWTITGERMEAEKVGIPQIPAHSDEFNSSDLGLQWQFNHNPVDGKWSLTEKNGYLTLNGLKSDSFKNAKNSVTQKSMGYYGEFTVKMELSDLENGNRAGLACMGMLNYQLGVMKTEGKLQLYMGNDDEKVIISKPVSGKTIYLRLYLDGISMKYSYAYSTDNKTFTPIGDIFEMDFGYWKGIRPAIFCYNTEGNGGKAHFDWARYEILDNKVNAIYLNKK